MRTSPRLLPLALLGALGACGGGGGGGPRSVGFLPPARIPLSLIPSETLVLDANRDGIDDIVVLGQGAAPGTGSRIQVHLGRRDGLDPVPSFSELLLDTFPPLSLRPRGVVTDSDGDGDEDVVFTFEPTQTEVIDEARVYLSAGDGTFTSWIHFAPPGPFYYGPIADVEVVDTDANSMSDLAVLYAPVSNPGGSWRLAQYVRDLAGALNLVGTPTALVRKPRRLHHADVNGDGSDDVLVEYGSPDQTEVYYASTAGYFWGTVLPLDVAGDVGGAVALADLDGNGTDEPVATPDSGGPQVNVYAGGFVFPSPPDPDVLGEKDLPLLGDLDGDGVLDMAVAIRAIGPSDAFSVFTGRGDLTFAPTSAVVPIAGPTIHTGVLTGALADVNGDRRLDLVHTEPGAAPGTYVLVVSLQD